MSLLRRWWIWPLFLLGVLAIVFTVFYQGGERRLKMTLPEFVAEVRAGNVLTAEVDGREIVFKLKDDAKISYRATMERGDTFRHVLQGAGIRPEDFPPYQVKEYSVAGEDFLTVPQFPAASVVHRLYRVPRATVP